MASSSNERNLKNLVINKVDSQSTFDQMKESGLINVDELYLIKEGTKDRVLDVIVNGESTVEDGISEFNVPTAVSELENDSGYITTAEETDPVFSASAAAGITSTDIQNWNNKTSSIGTITGVSVNGTSIATSGVANITSVPASILTGAIPSGVTATTQTQSDNSTKIATTAYVDTAIGNLPEPMVFKGSLGTGGTITALPTAAASNEGHTYKVIKDGTYAGQAAKTGDTFISTGSRWELIPSGDEPSGTVTSITLSATSPIAIDNSAAITTSGTRTISHTSSGVSAGTYKSVTVNSTGHVTGGTNPTTLSGYGITDAKIANGVITLGSNTITPLTEHQDIDGKVNKTGDTMTGKLTVPQVETGADDSSYFQTRKFRGEGNASSYYHAVDFGYTGHNEVDFYEYGGAYNFWKNTSASKTASDDDLCLGITATGLKNKGNTYTFPQKDGTFALTSDVPDITGKQDKITTTNKLDYSLIDNTPDISNYVPNTRTVNGKALSSNITLSASDTGAVAFDDTYITDANTFYSVNGYSKTRTSTTNLPSVCTGDDRWGVIFFIAENAPNHTGTQMYFPIDGTYKGRIFYRSMVKGTPSTWMILPTKTSELTNDSGFLTQHQDISGKQDKITTSNKLSYDLISGTPTIPTITDTYSATSSDGMSGKAVASAISGKQNSLTTQTAYSAKGSATKVPQITTNTLGQVTGITEVTITQPTVNNATLTIQKNGTNVATFGANASSNVTANITVPTVTDTYSAASSDAMSGKAVASALSSFHGGPENIKDGTATVGSLVGNRATLSSGSDSTALGLYTVVSSARSFATGYQPIVTGDASNAIGNYTLSSGSSSLSTGNHSIASGSGSIAMGSTLSSLNALEVNNMPSIGEADITNRVDENGLSVLTLSDGSFLNDTVLECIALIYDASGLQKDSKVIMGYNKTDKTITMGRIIVSDTYSQKVKIKRIATVAKGRNSFARGINAIAYSDYSVADGVGVEARSQNQRVEGAFNIVDTANKYAYILGNGTGNSNRSNAFTIDKDGNLWAKGDIKIGGTGYTDSDAKTVNAIANLKDGDAIGSVYTSGAIKPTANYAFADGYNTDAQGRYSHAEGYHSIASGERSHAENGVGSGSLTVYASGTITSISSDKKILTISGMNMNLSYKGLQPWGLPKITAINKNFTTNVITLTFEEAVNSSAGEQISLHLLGNQAIGEASHAEGIWTVAAERGSHAEGYCTSTSNEYQHVQGRFNAPDNAALFIVGNGSSSDQSNAMTVQQSGNLWVKHDIKVGGTKYNDATATVLTSENFHQYVDAYVQEILNRRY